MKSLALSVICIYLSICLALFLFQRKILYYPTPSSSFALSEDIKTVQFETGGETLRGWVLNEGQSRALIYYGGNAESVEYNLPLFQQLNLDYSVYFVPYRGYNDSTGSPTENKLYEDALAIYDALKPDFQKIALMGRSLGSGVATHVAARREIDKLVLVTPYDSIENVAKGIYWMLPISWLIKDTFRSYENVKNISAPTLILAAEKDRVIPMPRTLALASEFRTEQLSSIIVTGANHNDISLYPAFGAQLKQFLSSYRQLNTTAQANDS